jgi:hypothetical protein
MFKKDTPKVLVAWGADTLGSYPNTVEVEAKLGDLLGHLLHEVRRPMPTPEVPSLRAKLAGADGVQLYNPTPRLAGNNLAYRQVPLTTIVAALLDHLGLEVTVDASTDYYPAKLRKKGEAPTPASRRASKGSK